MTSEEKIDIETCDWIYDSKEFAWKTSCNVIDYGDQAFYKIFSYCPYCGKRITGRNNNESNPLTYHK